ncbi:MAG: hypothetical protein ACLPX1_11760 [Steroidobacteraceae bacterium]
MHKDPQAAGDPLPKNCELIEVRVTELKQLFNAMDASPFRERDLDPGAEDLIVGWAREAPRGATPALQVALDRAPGLAEEAEVLRDAVHEFFLRRAQVTRRHLRELLRIGRTSLMVGLVFLALAVTLGGVVASAMKGERLGELLRQGLVICGWVAMWRPLEILLYGWWPIRTEARLYDRLSEMPVRIEYTGTAEPDAWRQDWPAMPAAPTIPQKLPPRITSHRGMDDAREAAVTVPERGPIASVTIDAGTPKRASKDLTPKL